LFTHLVFILIELLDATNEKMRQAYHKAGASWFSNRNNRQATVYSGLPFLYDNNLPHL